MTLPVNETRDETANGDAELDRLAALSRFDYERQRQSVADRLRIRVTALDAEVDARRGTPNTEEGQGRALKLEIREPWPESVEGSHLLDELSAYIFRYVVLSESRGPGCGALGSGFSRVYRVLYFSSPSDQIAREAMREVNVAGRDCSARK